MIPMKSVSTVVASAAITILAIGQVRAERPADLVIQDTSTVAWMTFNNTFVHQQGQEWDRGRQYWDGVLIQVGDYLTDGVPLRDFQSIEFQFVNGSLRVDRGTFEWINIVAQVPGKDAPMGLQHLGLLYPDPNTLTGCDPVDACALQSCLAGASGPASCLRSRSLHGFFRPLAVITYWTGPRGYDVSIGPGVRGATESQHRFVFNDPFSVWVKYTGRPDPVLLDQRVQRIVVVDDPGVTHGDHNSPPWEP